MPPLAGFPGENFQRGEPGFARFRFGLPAARPLNADDAGEDAWNRVDGQRGEDGKDLLVEVFGHPALLVAGEGVVVAEQVNPEFARARWFGKCGRLQSGRGLSLRAGTFSFVKDA